MNKKERDKLCFKKHIENLLKLNADCAQQNIKFQNRTTLHQAAEYGNYDMLEELYKDNKKPDSQVKKNPDPKDALLLEDYLKENFGNSGLKIAMKAQTKDRSGISD